MNEAAEKTIEQRAEDIAEVLQKYYTKYDYLLTMDKARIFDFRIDDNRYNLDLHGLVLKKLGLICIVQKFMKIIKASMRK